jgi:hypothetical protein
MMKGVVLWMTGWSAALAVAPAAPAFASIPSPSEQAADERAVLAADARPRLAVASADATEIGKIFRPTPAGERAEQSNTYS